MCIFVKDNDEQCGMSNHDGLWCRHHEDSRQAAAYQQGHTAAQSGSSPMEEEVHCNVCERSLHRFTRPTTHPNQPRRLVFEDVVACDCTERVLYTKSFSSDMRPANWSL